MEGLGQGCFQGLLQEYEKNSHRTPESKCRGLKTGFRGIWRLFRKAISGNCYLFIPICSGAVLRIALFSR